MDYIIAGIAILGPILLGIFGKLFIQSYLPSYFDKKAENLATKEDIGAITKEIEEVKNIYKMHYDLSKTEMEFYQEMIKIIYEFLAKIKEYEFRGGNNSATKDAILEDPILKQDFFKFINSANEFIGKSYVFLKEDNYINLKNAINTTSNFADLTNNLLYAMRISIYSSTELTPKENLKEFNYKES